MLNKVRQSSVTSQCLLSHLEKNVDTRGIKGFLFLVCISKSNIHVFKQLTKSWTLWICVIGTSDITFLQVNVIILSCNLDLSWLYYIRILIKVFNCFIFFHVLKFLSVYLLTIIVYDLLWLLGVIMFS